MKLQFFRVQDQYNPEKDNAGNWKKIICRLKIIFSVGWVMFAFWNYWREVLKYPVVGKPLLIYFFNEEQNKGM